MKPCRIALVLAAPFLAMSPLEAQAFLNGDFESGNTGFTSDYQFAAGNSTEGQYSVRNDPQNWNRAFANFGDHTSGSGKMLVVNGATSGNPAIWRQTLALEANTSYRFRAWTGTAVSGGPAKLYLKINGTQVGPSFVLPASSGSWVLWEQPWTSSAAGDHTFEIVNSNTSSYPNDFYVDDIGISRSAFCLSSSVTPGGLALSWPADPGWGLFTSTSLTGGSWSPVAAVPSTALGIRSLVLPMNGPRAFFRLQRVQ